ncbi:MAG: aminodeoxychorismate lyase [Bacilli bacterium]|nr:aminodeoxychorismate lyase [Bacilli bacterium]
MDLPEQGSERSKSRLRKILKVVLIVLGAIVILLAAASFFAWRYVSQQLQPTPASDQAVRFTIPAGSDSTHIAHILQDKGLIRNPMLFVYYLKYSKQGDQFKAGTYEMKPGIAKAQLIDQLNKGNIVKQEMLRFTIPEGFTVQQIAVKLSSQNAVTIADFLKIADTKQTYPCKYAASIPEDKTIKHRLEGYLYPDTYEMEKNSTSADIIERMLCEWDSKLNQLPDDWQTQLAARSLTFHELLTLASLIEREVVLDEERPIVAGIIYNRIKQKMPLQIDATIQYLFDKPKDRLFEKDLKLASPYNTYLHAGLPPGPIASPSLASIRAALYPTDTKFLYYVTKKDGSHGHLFAETLSEHNNNIAKSNAKK